MQSAWVTMTNRLFPSCGGINGIERKGDFDEFFGALDRVHGIP
jgi:hypothetical protein